MSATTAKEETRKKTTRPDNSKKKNPVVDDILYSRVFLESDYHKLNFKWEYQGYDSEMVRK